jgi:hypothetical protein
VVGFLLAHCLFWPHLITQGGMVGRLVGLIPSSRRHSRNGSAGNVWNQPDGSPPMHCHKLCPQCEGDLEPQRHDVKRECNQHIIRRKPRTVNSTSVASC